MNKLYRRLKVTEKPVIADYKVNSYAPGYTYDCYGYSGADAFALSDKPAGDFVLRKGAFRACTSRAERFGVPALMKPLFTKADPWAYRRLYIENVAAYGFDACLVIPTKDEDDRCDIHAGERLGYGAGVGVSQVEDV